MRYMLDAVLKITAGLTFGLGSGCGLLGLLCLKLANDFVDMGVWLLERTSAAKE